jgi:hypothetical protein
MSEKKVIKVVKREERVIASKKKSKSKSAPQKAHDMVTTVTGWVNDFQHQRRDETTTAIKNLVRARQQPNEA